MIGKEIDRAVEILKKGGVILYPTDTIWGIGCDATNPEAVRRIYEIKQREDTRSMLVLLSNENQLLSYVSEVPGIAWELIEVSTQPMTIIYPGAKNLAPNLPAEDGSIGIRITRETFSSGLLDKFRKALVSTSANKSGEPSPQNFSEISDYIKDSVDHVVDYRQDDFHKYKPSSIIKLGMGGEIKIIRK